MADLGDTNPSFTYTGTNKPWADYAIELNEKIDWFKNLIDIDSEKDLNEVIAEFKNLLDHALDNDLDEKIEVFRVLIENSFETGVDERVDTFKKLVDDLSENENIEHSVQERVDQDKADRKKTNEEKSSKNATKSRKVRQNAAKARQQKVEEQTTSASKEQDEQQVALKSIKFPEYSDNLKLLENIQTKTAFTIPVVNSKVELFAHRQNLLEILKKSSDKTGISSEKKCIFGERVAEDILVSPTAAPAHKRELLDYPKILSDEKIACLSVVTESSGVVDSTPIPLPGYFQILSDKGEDCQGRIDTCRLAGDHALVPAHKREASRIPSNEVERCLGRLIEGILVSDHTPTPTQNLELLGLSNTPLNPGKGLKRSVECKQEIPQTPIPVEARELSTLLNWGKLEEPTIQEGAVPVEAASPPPASEVSQRLDEVQTKLDSLNLAHRQPEIIITLNDELREDSIYRGVDFAGLSKACWDLKSQEETTQEPLSVTPEEPSTSDSTKVQTLFALVKTSIQCANIFEFMISILIAMVASVVGHRTNIME